MIGKLDSAAYNRAMRIRNDIMVFVLLGIQTKDSNELRDFEI